MKNIIKEYCDYFMENTQDYIRRTDLVNIIYEFNFLLHLDYKYKLNCFNLSDNKELTIKEFFEIWKKILIKEDCNILENEKRLLGEIIEELEYLQYIKFYLNNLLNFMMKYDDDFIKEIMVENLFDYYGMQGAIYSSSSENVKLANKLLEINKDDNVLDLCSGIGDFLTFVHGNNDYKSITGIEINRQANLINEIRLTVLGAKYTTNTEDVLTSQINNKYEKVFSEYPLGVRIDKFKMEEIMQTNEMRFKWVKMPANSTDWIFINILLTVLKENGKAITIVPDGPLFKTADKKYKEDLLKNNLIETIIKLPRAFNKWVSINLNMVVFSSNNKEINMIDASKEEKAEDILKLINEESDKKRKVSIEEILENDSVLTVNNYIGNQKIEYHNPQKLSQYVTDIFRGYQLTASEQKKLEDENGEYEILTISNIKNGIIDDNLVRIKSDKNIERYLVKNGDIIISSKGTRIKIAVANFINRKVIANGNLIVLRIDQTRLNPFYLAMYLNSTEGKNILKQIQTGTVIISINPSRLKNIKISTFDIEKQEKMAKKYLAKQQQYIMAKNHLEQLKMELDNFYDQEIERLNK